MAARPLTVDQIAELGGISVETVYLYMRRGHIPSQEPEVIREWLFEQWSKSKRYAPEVDDGPPADT